MHNITSIGRKSVQDNLSTVLESTVWESLSDVCWTVYPSCAKYGTTRTRKQAFNCKDSYLLGIGHVVHLIYLVINPQA
jgi:hypothetical protein